MSTMRPRANRDRDDSIDTSTVARMLRELIHDRIMSGVATEHDRKRADALAHTLGLPPPSVAGTLKDLNDISKRAFARLDLADAALDAGAAESGLADIPKSH